MADQRAREIGVLKDLAETLNQTLPPERALEAGLKQAATDTGAAFGWLLTLTPDRKAELSASHGLPDGFELAEGSGSPWALCACLKETLNGRLNTPRPFVCERLARMASSNTEHKRHLSVPIRASGVPVGILNLVFHAAPEFSEAELRTITALGDQFGGAVERSRLFREVHQLAVTDPLTGLYNRRAFLSSVSQEIERARRYQHPISLVILDIDLFKSINDTYGHLVGDQVLMRVAQLCQEATRRTDLVARYGGEEIIILMPETTQEQALAAMERLRVMVETEEIDSPRGLVRTTISAGIASLDVGASEVSSFDQLLDHADQALYLAKNEGRNRVRVL
jgi:diguanylate cyclase (GGDEF)-like protein